MKIAVAGFQHETNTFGPARADYAEFVKRDAWPGLTQGAAMLRDTAGMNLPVSGFIDAARRRHEILPLLWCSAEPSSYVTKDAFERITGMLCDGLQRLTGFDAVYLDLHGAMVAEHVDDGEGEVLRRVRDIIGADMPLVISLDLHANVTEAMLRHADVMTIFRTYPHVDMATTGARALELLESIAGGERPAKGMRKLPFLVPLQAQCTDFEPSRAIYARLDDLRDRGILSMDFAAGFPAADIADCGGAVVAYGADQACTDQAVSELYEFILARENDFDTTMYSAGDAVSLARQNTDPGPVVLADAQDNPGAGASSDTVGLLRALVEGGARGAVLAIVNDPEVAGEAHRAGTGNVIRCALGGKSGQPGQMPFDGQFMVEGLGDGRFVCTGEMYRGAHTELGPMALLKVKDPDCDVRVIVGSERFQCLDQAIFRHLGVEPAEQRILAVKSSVHFRADFDPIAARTLVVESPGAHPCRLTDVVYKNLRPGVRLGPGGPVHGRG